MALWSDRVILCKLLPVCTGVINFMCGSKIVVLSLYMFSCYTKAEISLAMPLSHGHMRTLNIFE